MKAGILSDSHDNLEKIRKAVLFFNRRKVDFVFHAGDFIAPFAVAELKKLKCEWKGVFGNNDGEKKGLLAVSGGRIKRPPFMMNLGGKRIIVVHDINKINLRQAKSDLVIFGHSHKPVIAKCYKKLIVNPGECGGWLSGRASVAIVDIDLLSARIYRI